MVARNLVLIFSLTMLMVAYQNCGSTDNYSIGKINKSTSVVGDQRTPAADTSNTTPTQPVAQAGVVVDQQPILVQPDPTYVVAPTPAPIPQNTTQLITSCDKAIAAGKLLTQTIEVNFEDPGKVCNWGVGNALSVEGNMSTKDGYIRARTTQDHNIVTAKGAIICSIDMKNLDEQKFLYDDNIFITLNDYVLASTSNFTKHLTSTNGYYKYDWSKLVDKAAQNAASDTTLANQYCAGADQGLSSCAFPETEKVGAVKLAFQDRVIENILGITSPTFLKLSVITTGDNDSTDCQHVPLRFSVAVKYYQ